MIQKIRFSLLILFFFAFFSGLTAQEAPRVFQLGTYGEEHDALYTAYTETLFGACDDNLDSTFLAWGSLLLDMERYADEIDFDLKGIQLMLAVFCSPEGEIEHLAYGLAPASRNVQARELTAFFSQYIDNSNWKKENPKPFFHDGRAAFPVQAILFKE